MDSASNRRSLHDNSASRLTVIPSESSSVEIVAEDTIPTEDDSGGTAVSRETLLWRRDLTCAQNLLAVFTPQRQNRQATVTISVPQLTLGFGCGTSRAGGCPTIHVRSYITICRVARHFMGLLPCKDGWLVEEAWTKCVHASPVVETLGKMEDDRRRKRGLLCSCPGSDLCSLLLENKSQSAS